MDKIPNSGEIMCNCQIRTTSTTLLRAGSISVRGQGSSTLYANVQMSRQKVDNRETSVLLFLLLLLQRRYLCFVVVATNNSTALGIE